MGLVGALLTALYMTRLMGLTFWGQSRVDPNVEKHIHEVPPAMKYVLIALAVLSVFGGALGVPGAHFLERWLEPTFAASVAGHGAAEAASTGAAGAHGTGLTPGSAGESHAAGAAAGGHHVSGTTEIALMVVSLAVAATGILIGMRYYRRGRGEEAAVLAKKAGVAYRMLQAKYWVDEIYDATVLRAYYKLCEWTGRFDVSVVDGVVNGTRHFTVGSSYLSAIWDSWVVDGLVNLVGHTIRGGSWVLRKVQSGFVQAYAAVMIFGMFVLLVVYLYLEMGSR
jgi:NADH-quinone oxidoreductase subunit L